MPFVCLATIVLPLMVQAENIHLMRSQAVSLEIGAGAKPTPTDGATADKAGKSDETAAAKAAKAAVAEALAKAAKAAVAEAVDAVAGRKAALKGKGDKGAAGKPITPKEAAAGAFPTDGLVFSIRADKSKSGESIVDSSTGIQIGGKPITSEDSYSCWDLTNDFLQRTGGETLIEGQNYTHAVWVKWSQSEGWRTLFRTDPDHSVIVQNNTLGMWSNRASGAEGGFRGSGYDITNDLSTWQLVVVTGAGSSPSGSSGTSTFYTGALGLDSVTQRGTADRVVSGTPWFQLGYKDQGPGMVAAAYEWNRSLTISEMNQILHCTPDMAGCAGKSDETACEDTAGYTDPKGWACAGWLTSDCTKAVANWNYSQAQQDAVIANCRKSCGLCSAGKKIAPEAAKAEVETLKATAEAAVKMAVHKAEMAAKKAALEGKGDKDAAQVKGAAGKAAKAAKKGKGKVKAKGKGKGKVGRKGKGKVKAKVTKELYEKPEDSDEKPKDSNRTEDSDEKTGKGE